MNEGNQDNRHRHQRVVSKLLLVVIGMFGFGYALVPLYNVFCDITGLNGRVGVEAASELDYVIDPNRQISLEFITSVNEDTPLRFQAKTAKMKVIPGKSYRVEFIASNLKGASMTGRAVPSVAPGLASKYLKKTECFCFDEQNFEAGEEKLMPVRFVIDPALPEDYKDVTLAYTFFEVSKKL